MIMRSIILLLCLLLTGCVAGFTVPDREVKARNHMALAESEEVSQDFAAAINAYAFIAKEYKDTGYFKFAVRKAALLNIHPNNPEIDYKAALDWLSIYSGLRLTAQEAETALLMAALIREINLSRDEKNSIVQQIAQAQKKKANLENELKRVRANKKKITQELKKMRACEAKITILEEKLRKMKEIDVQRHQKKKSGTMIIPKNE